jgi:hypothetical protein
MSIVVFWDVIPCSIVGIVVYRPRGRLKPYRFRQIIVASLQPLCSTFVKHPVLALASQGKKCNIYLAESHCLSVYVSIPLRLLGSGMTGRVPSALL